MLSATKRATRRTRRADATRDTDIAAARTALAGHVRDYLDDNDITQTEAAYRMHDAASQVSLVTTGKLRGFSFERLLRMNKRLGYDIDITVRPSTENTGRVKVIAGRRRRAAV